MSVFNSRARVAAALGEHRMLPIMKDDVIAYLIVTDWPPDQREALYRAWAKAVNVDVLRSDLQRARAGRRRELNGRLDLCPTDDSTIAEK